MAKPAILTITLNPAFDLSTEVDQVQPGKKLRCAVPTVSPGGGGLNVSRALAHLGQGSVALVALGGATGSELARHLKAEGIKVIALEAPGDTRQSLSVTDRHSGVQYRFLLPGPVWSAGDQARLLTRLNSLSKPGTLAVISGSQPPGLPADFPRQMALALTGCGVVLDTSGPALEQAIARPIPGLAVLRMDSDEAEALAGHPLPTPQATADFAETLRAKGAAATVIVARGAEGNVLVSAGLRLFARPPKVPVISAIGAGDSFVAGLVQAMAGKQGWPEALALATASAAAAVMTPATELCRAEDVARLLPQVEISAL